MEYKVLIKLLVPEIESTYEMYIPINKTLVEVSKQLNQLVSNMSGVYPVKEVVHLYNRRTGAVYGRNVPIRETDIRNGTELVMVG